MINKITIQGKILMGMITLTLYLNLIPSFTTMSSDLLKNVYMKFCDFVLKVADILVTKCKLNNFINKLRLYYEVTVMSSFVTFERVSLKNGALP